MTFAAASFGERAFSEDIFQHTYVTPTGVSGTFSLGTATVTGTALVTPSGVQATFSVGSVTVSVVTEFQSLDWL